MKKIFEVIDKILEWICFLSIAGFTALVFLQVVFRYVLKNPLHWQEEICLYLLYMVVLSGAVRAVKNSEHISVDFINQRLNERQQLLLRIITSVFILICCLFITYSGFLYATSVGNRRSGELRVLMKYVYSLFPVLGGLMSLYAVRNIVESSVRFFKKEDVT